MIDLYIQILEQCINTLKEKNKMKYEITEEQIKENKHLTLEQYFKEVFDVKLEVGRWYKWKSGAICCHTEDKEDYGFNSLGECIPNNHWLTNGCNDGFTPATDSEVLEALRNEFKKRNPNIRVYDWLYNSEQNILGVWLGDGRTTQIFNNGIWTKFHTKEEAEKILNAKIV